MVWYQGKLTLGRVQNGLVHLICIAGMLCIWFLLSIVLDQLRVVIWNSVMRIKDYNVDLSNS